MLKTLIVLVIFFGLSGCTTLDKSNTVSIPRERVNTSEVKEAHQLILLPDGGAELR